LQIKLDEPENVDPEPVVDWDDEDDAVVNLLPVVLCDGVLPLVVTNPDETALFEADVTWTLETLLCWPVVPLKDPVDWPVTTLFWCPVVEEPVTAPEVGFVCVEGTTTAIESMDIQLLSRTKVVSKSTLTAETLYEVAWKVTLRRTAVSLIGFAVLL